MLVIDYPGSDNGRYVKVVVWASIVHIVILSLLVAGAMVIARAKSGGQRRSFWVSQDSFCFSNREFDCVFSKNICSARSQGGDAIQTLKLRT